MAEGKFISYLRVSTAAQGRSGLGIEAQRTSVDSYLNDGDWELVAEYVEVESGKKTDRVQLGKALRHAELTGATLIIAKLDRLSRDAAFLLRLQNEGVRFIAADMALVAQQESSAISIRTKEALAAAKARGVKLGNPNGARCLRGIGNTAAIKARQTKADCRASKVFAIIQEIQAEGITSKNAIAKALNTRAIQAPRGGAWFAASVSRVMERMK